MEEEIFRELKKSFDFNLDEKFSNFEKKLKLDQIDIDQEMDKIFKEKWKDILSE